MPALSPTFRFVTKSLLGGLLLAGLVIIPVIASAQDAPTPGEKRMEIRQMMMATPTTLTFSANGEVSATPDMATISFGVVTQGSTASDALKGNNVRMNSVLAALKSAGIAEKDIQTSSLNLNPQYDYTDGQHPKLTGYQAQNQISVRVNDLKQTGPVIDTVIKAGINQVDSINFGLKNDDALLDQARQSAVKTLMQRAELYATATGMKVKRIVNLSEGGPSYVEPPRPVMMLAKRAADSSTPVAAGEMQMSVSVSATFELEK